MALCELDLNAFKRILADDALPRTDVRRHMLAAADEVHTRLARQFQPD